MFKYIIYFFGIKLPDEVTPVAEVLFHVGIISLIILLSFINVFGYLIVLYFVQLNEEKYSKFRWLINYFKRSSWLMIIIEAIIGFSALIVLIFLGLYPLFSN